MTIKKSKKKVANRKPTKVATLPRQKEPLKGKELVNRYTFKIEWVPSLKCHQARCVMFPSLSGVGASPAAALKQIQLNVAKELRNYKKKGMAPPLAVYEQAGGY